MVLWRQPFSSEQGLCLASDYERVEVLRIAADDIHA